MLSWDRFRDGQLFHGGGLKGKCCHGTGPEHDNYFKEADRRVSVVIRQDLSQIYFMEADRRASVVIGQDLSQTTNSWRRIER